MQETVKQLRAELESHKQRTKEAEEEAVAAAAQVRRACGVGSWSGEQAPWRCGRSGARG